MKTNKLALWIFLFPALFLLAVFAFLPIVASIIMSFFRVDIQGLLHPSTIQFVGIRYYTDVLFHGSLLYKALLNTIIVLVIAMPLTIIISLVLAVMVGSKMTNEYFG